MPSASSNKRAPGLSRDRIVRAAYQISKKDPVKALSMRRVAAKLGVTPMSIYKYFEDKDELTAAVLDLHMTKSKLLPDDCSTENWRAWVTESALRLWDALDDAPGIVQYLNRATSFGPAVLSWQDSALKVLMGGGLTPKQALTGLAAISELAVGSNTLLPITKLGVQGIFPRLWRAIQDGEVDLNELSETPEAIQYPCLFACGEAILENMEDGRASFTDRLNLIMDRLELQIEINKEAEG